MDEEDAWRAISAAEEELRSEEALASLKPGDESIPELLLTRVMEREMLTRDEAGKAAEDWLSSPEGIDYMIHAVAKETGRQVPPHDPCFNPENP